MRRAPTSSPWRSSPARARRRSRPCPTATGPWSTATPPGREPGTDGAGITLQVFTPDGGDFGLVQVTDFSAPDESDPDVTVLANGFVLVTWSRPTGAANTDIIGRLFDQEGSPVEIAGDDREFVITSSASDDKLPSVSALLAGQYITSWQDSFTGDGSGGRITSEISEFLRTSVGDGAADTMSATRCGT